MTFRALFTAALPFAITAAAAAASWEDPAPAPVGARPSYTRPQPAYAPRETPRYEEPSRQDRSEYLVSVEGDDGGYYELDLYSQHLDADVRNVYAIGLAYVSETEFGPYGATDMAEADIEFRLFRFDEFLWGSFDAWVDAHAIGFIENPDMGALPDAVIDAALDIGMTWRFVNGWSTEVRAAPGLYSDVAEPAFSIPLTLNFYYAVNPDLSIKLGGTVRPGWDIPFMPNVGVAWQPADVLRIEAMLPKSAVTLFPGYIASVFGTFEWRNVTYALADEPGTPEDMTLDDMLVTAGAALCPFGDYRIVGEYGVFLQRELSADVEENAAIDLSKESFIRVMIKGAF